VLFPGTGRDEAAARAEGLRWRIGAAPLSLTDGRQVTVTCSVGVAEMPSDAVEPAALLASADRRLLAAKRAGRDRMFMSDL
jgi:diguanylate cyclase (GGDEF)-like protein